MNARLRIQRLFVLVVGVCALLLAFPTTALADKDYSLDGTSIWATVDTDGTLHVVSTLR